MSKRLQSAKQNNFAEVVSADIRRSTFLRRSGNKTSFNCGYLVPVYSDEVLPGDTRKITVKSLSRLSTPIFPTMDNLELEFFAIFCPNRIEWDGWEELMGANKTGAWAPQVAPALVPGVVGVDGSGNALTVPSKSIGDYYGLPVGMDLSKVFVNNLRLRGYVDIWNEWFRDENLQAPIVNPKDNYDIADSLRSHPCNGLLKVNKFHDYFTSALPAPLKGDSPLVPIELNKLIPVITGEDNDLMISDLALNGYNSKYHKGLHMKLSSTSMNDLPEVPSSHQLGVFYGSTGDIVGDVRHVLQPDSRTYMSSGAEDVPVNLYADASQVGNLSTTTISELRTLFQIQKILERDARCGTRYVELLKSVFNVDAGDYRLQRPEFLGHYKTTVGMQSVPQTSATADGVSPQGNLAAYSVTFGNSTLVNKSFVEHGYIHIFAVVRQVKIYQQGLEKSWSRRERFDFYRPELAHISEQPILNKEIYAYGDDVDELFGYQEAWADYRYKPNMVTASMRTNSVNALGASDTLDTWHYADWYEEKPTLSSDWIQDNSDVNVRRTLATTEQTADQVRMDVLFLDVATRPMPVYSIPGLVDHF